MQAYATLVGSRFYGASETVAAYEYGKVVGLAREPENKFDENAIAVYDDGKKVGHINKEIAKALAPHLDNGVNFTATVQGFDQRGPILLIQKAEVEDNGDQ